MKLPLVLAYCLALLLPLAPAPVRGQGATVETLVFDGASIRLIVPAGFCKLEHKVANDDAFFAYMAKTLPPSQHLLLAFGDCETVKSYRTFGGIREGKVSLGTYTVSIAPSVPPGRIGARSTLVDGPVDPPEPSPPPGRKPPSGGNCPGGKEPGLNRAAGGEALKTLARRLVCTARTSPVVVTAMAKKYRPT